MRKIECVGGVDGILYDGRGVTRELAISPEGCLPTLTANAVNIPFWQVLSSRRYHIHLLLC